MNIKKLTKVFGNGTPINQTASAVWSGHVVKWEFSGDQYELELSEGIRGIVQGSIAVSPDRAVFTAATGEQTEMLPKHVED